ncbi:MAG: hypothetical protein SF029_05410 [bacterium]|nr:hypothetical protein [bacterium]
MRFKPGWRLRWRAFRFAFKRPPLRRLMMRLGMRRLRSRLRRK